MFVWPPMPLQPLDDGNERKLAHSDRFSFPMIMAPASRSPWTMNASSGVLPARAHEPAVVGIPVVLMLSFRSTGIPSSGQIHAAFSRLVCGTRVGQGCRAHEDHRIEHRVELLDPVQIELRQLYGGQAVSVHQILQLRNRLGIHVDARHLGRGWCLLRQHRRRDGTESWEHQGDHGQQNDRTPGQAAHRRPPR